MQTQKQLKTLIFLGILVAVVPFLGVLDSWKRVVVVLAGIAVSVLAFSMSRTFSASNGKSSPTFVENGKDEGDKKELPSSEPVKLGIQPENE